MGLNHTKRVWELPLPSTERFVLMSLADHANDNETCWPSNERIGERTGFCTKTVSRALLSLRKLGLISVDKSKKYHVYKLHINCELKYLVGYLKYHAKESKYATSENLSSQKDLESSKLYNITSSGNDTVNKDIIENYAKAEYQIKPSEAKAPYEDLWLNLLYIMYKGWEGEITDVDKWNLNDIKPKMQGYPEEIVFRYVIRYWKQFVKEVFAENPKMKYLKIKVDLPSTEFLLRNIEHAKSFALTMHSQDNLVD
jgi:hypothetical protein